MNNNKKTVSEQQKYMHIKKAERLEIAIPYIYLVLNSNIRILQQIKKTQG